MLSQVAGATRRLAVAVVSLRYHTTRALQQCLVGATLCNLRSTSCVNPELHAVAVKGNSRLLL